MNKVLSLKAVIFFVICGSLNASIEYRLNSSVIPHFYDIAIKPYLHSEDGDKQFTFEGEVNITIHANKMNVREIVIHKDYIEIKECILYNGNGRSEIEKISVRNLEYDSTTDKLTIKLSNPLIVELNYLLRFVYVGQIRNGMAGVYRANYIDEIGNEKWIAITQLQRIDARTAFPCFDEPTFKAKFRMRINRPTEYNARFNSRLITTEDVGQGRVIDQFEETPLMSTYLVAFLVSDFKVRGNDNLPLIIRSEYLNKTDFAVEVTYRALQAYNNYTLLPYKTLGNSILQTVGVPIFPHNGMENWGLIVYKESVLVNEPGYTDGWTNKEYTATIIVHEVAHMWFGNSVTFAWWSYFWLNEAFARYYQYFMTHELYPEYQLDIQFVINQMHLIFATDAVNSTQPMTTSEVEVQSPSEIARKFSGIAYAKGACIVRMIRNLMGAGNFVGAMRDYLSQNQLGSVVPSDLFIHLKAHWPEDHNVNLDDFFYDWTELVGFPFLKVSIDGSRKTLLVQQQRFLLNPTDGSDCQLRYTVPITFTTDLENNFYDLTPKTYFNKSNDNCIFQLNEQVQWVIFNLQQSNYHRVFYEEPLLTAIKTALFGADHNNIHVINRAHIIDDLFNFALARIMDYADVFEFNEYLSGETHYLPWFAAFKGMQRVVNRLTLSEQNNFTSYLLNITAKVYERLGLHNDNDTVLDVYNRNMVVSWLCKYKHSDCNEQARRILERVHLVGKKPAPDFRKIVYCSAVRYGTFVHYSILSDWFKLETLPSEKKLLAYAMGCTYHFSKIHYINILSGIISQEYMIAALTPLYAENPENVTPVFKMIADTIESLARALGTWSTAANVISDIAEYFTTKEQKNMLEAFIAEHGYMFGSSIATLTGAIDRVESNLQWAADNLNRVKIYLAARNSSLILRVISLLLFCMFAVTQIP